MLFLNSWRGNRRILLFLGCVSLMQLIFKIVLDRIYFWLIVFWFFGSLAFEIDGTGVDGRCCWSWMSFGGICRLRFRRKATIAQSYKSNARWKKRVELTWTNEDRDWMKVFFYIFRCILVWSTAWFLLIRWLAEINIVSCSGLCFFLWEFFSWKYSSVTVLQS